MSNKEYRSINQEIKTENRIVEGYAVVFNSESEDLGFTEIIRPGAITDETIRKSDIFAKFNHDDNKILARCRHGVGSLSLSLDEHGLRYKFDCPHTAAGDELLEYLSRGDVFASSFAFSVDKAVGEKWTKKNGRFYREINTISELYDVSPVFQPAYSETSCCKRFLEVSNLSDELEKTLSEYDAIADDFGKEILSECRAEIRGLNDDEIKYFSEIRAKLDDEKDSEKTDETEDTNSENTETNTDENNTSDEVAETDKENVSDSPEDDENNEVSETDLVDTDTDTDKKDKRNYNYNSMEKHNFSLLRSIRNIVNNRAMNEIDAAVINAGQQEMRSAGVNAAGQIQLPVNELRAITVANEGSDVIATDVLDVISPMMAKFVVNELGARQMHGLVGDVLVPVMTSANANFVAETADATLDNNISFSSVKLSPKRLSTVVAVSKQFLIQDSASAEAAIRQNIIDSLSAKYQSVVLGSAAGTATQPAGLFYTTDVTEISDFEDLTEFEAAAEEANVADCKYLISPKAKAALRNMTRGGSHVGNVFENGEVDGTAAISVSDVKDTFIAYGDFSNCLTASWGGVDLCVDPYTLSAAGQVRIVATVWVDFKNARPEAIKIGKIKKATAVIDSSTH